MMTEDLWLDCYTTGTQCVPWLWVKTPQVFTVYFGKDILVLPSLNSYHLQGETPAENTLEKSQLLWANCSLSYLSGQF